MKNKKILRDFLFFTVIPFIIPFFNEISEQWVSNRAKWVIIIIIATIDFFCAYRSLLSKEKENNDKFIQKSIRYAYSGAHEIIERKREILSHETEVSFIDVKNNILPYDVHFHVNNICKDFKKVIAEITRINTEYISVTFIYRYTYEGCSENDKQWKWIAGREPISDFDLNEFVDKEDTTFYHIIHDKMYYIFGNNKELLAGKGLYHIGARDKMYNNIGSVFSIKLAFGNNFTNYVEGIITVTTHGKFFTDNINMELDNAEEVLKKMVIDEIFPYYKELIETELGLLYFRHINKIIEED